MNSVIGVLAGENEREKIEVLLDRQDPSEARLSLRLLSWGDGIGWYPQKTLMLGPREIGTLETLLKQARALMQTTKRKTPPKGKVIPFPLRPETSRTVESRKLKQAY
ncbi:MAG: hypothetical protein ACE5GK_10060 [Nitrospiria bacterium]